jgi:hypothetical protein
MAWLLLLVTAGLAWLLHKKWKKWRKWYVVALVTALLACALASTNLGGWLASLLGGLLGLIGGLIGVSGSLIGAVLMLLFIPAIVYGFWHDRKADKWEVSLLILLPLLFVVASGPVAAHGGGLVTAVSHFGTSGLGYLVHS